MSLLGKLLFMIKIRLEIEYAVSQMTTRAMKATKKEFAVLLRVVLYLGATRD